MRSFLTTRSALLVYKSMMLPILEYGDIFLSATTCEIRKKLQTLQNKGLRCALNKGLQTSSSELHNKANLLALRYRREQHLLNYMFDWTVKVNEDMKALTPKPTYCTRSQNKKILKTKKPNTEKFKKSLAYFGPKKWNALPADIHQIPSKLEFKRSVKTWVGGKACSSNS